MFGILLRSGPMKEVGCHLGPASGAYGEAVCFLQDVESNAQIAVRSSDVFSIAILGSTRTSEYDGGQWPLEKVIQRQYSYGEGVRLSTLDSPGMDGALGVTATATVTTTATLRKREHVSHGQRMGSAEAAYHKERSMHV